MIDFANARHEMRVIRSQILKLARELGESETRDRLQFAADAVEDACDWMGPQEWVQRQMADVEALEQGRREQHRENLDRMEELHDEEGMQRG